MAAWFSQGATHKTKQRFFCSDSSAMDPTLNPSIPGVCEGDYTNITSKACGLAMVPLCSSGTPQVDASGTGVMRSALLDPASNCSLWGSALELLSAGGNSETSVYLDAAKRAYCRGDGANTPECECINFPLLASTFCSSGASVDDCPQTPAGSCQAKTFAQLAENGDAPYTLLTFPACNPYYCWLSACFEPSSSQLVTSDMVAAQSTQGTCQPMCIEIEGPSTLTVPPMPANSFQVNSSLMNKCGSDLAGPTPGINPAVYDVNSNAMMRFLIGVANDGDLPLILSVSSASLPYASLEPPFNFTVPGRTVRNWILDVDQAEVQSISAASGSSMSTLLPKFTAIYPDSKGVINSITFGYTLNVRNLPPPRTIPVERIPVGAVVVCVLAALIILFSYRAYAKDRLSILRTLAKSGINVE